MSDSHQRDSESSSEPMGGTTQAGPLPSLLCPSRGRRDSMSVCSILEYTRGRIYPRKTQERLSLKDKAKLDNSEMIFVLFPGILGSEHPLVFNIFIVKRNGLVNGCF